MSFIEDLLDEIKTKKASDDKDGDDKGGGKKPPFFAKKDDDKDDRKGRDGDGDGKKNEDEDKEKKANALFAELYELHPELKKLAALEADTDFLVDIKRAQLFGQPAQKAAATINEEEVFNNAFAARIQKWAAVDPQFAEIVEQEQVKRAFDEGFEAELQKIKVAYNLSDDQIAQFKAANGLAA